MTRPRHGLKGAVVMLLLGLLATGFFLTSEDPEIALKLGEPWVDMQQRSTVEIGPALPGEMWYRVPASDARLRLVDPQYGFITPLARFFTVSFVRDGTVRSVRMSPQVEPLLLDETLAILLDLQKQWEEGGWQLVDGDEDPPISDTPELRAWMRVPGNDTRVRWRANDQYQVTVWAARTRDTERPDEERYLITLELARPWR